MWYIHSFFRVTWIANTSWCWVIGTTVTGPQSDSNGFWMLYLPRWLSFAESIPNTLTLPVECHCNTAEKVLVVPTNCRFSKASTSSYIFVDAIGKYSLDCIIWIFKVYFFNKYLLSVYSIPEKMPRARDTEWIRDLSLCLMGPGSQLGNTNN